MIQLYNILYFMDTDKIQESKLLVVKTNLEKV